MAKGKKGAALSSAGEKKHTMEEEQKRMAQESTNRLKSLSFGELIATKKVSSKVVDMDADTGNYDGSVYVNDRKASDVYHLLDMVAEPAVSEFDYITLGQNCITKHSIDTLARHMGISRKNLAEHIFDISVKTLERKTPTEKLDKKISSHAVEIAKLLQHANEVFGDEDKVRQWINTKNTALNNNTPISILDTLTGLNLVNNVLIRIEEGVYS